jgi:DNA-binding response OmpR family regulator
MTPHILIVDDLADLTAVFQYYFESMGYRVSVAGSGEAALALEQADPADLVISDLSMPGMSGRELVMQLRRRRAGLPIIMMSGYAGDEPLVHGRTSFFVKPVNLALLNQQVQELLVQAGADAVALKG